MVYFREITTANVDEVMKLRVGRDQERFVADNARSLAQAYAARNEGFVALPLAVYDEETLIGFIMFGYGDLDDPDSPAVSRDNYCIWRLMVDAKQQGRGYGRAVMRAALEYLRTFPAGAAEYVWISYREDNARARHVYRQAGFVENGQRLGDELIAVRKLAEGENLL